MRMIWVLCGLMLAGCELDPEPPSGAQLFADNCADCHGVDASGTGWIAAGLSVKPADLTTLAARNGGTFPMTQVLSDIDGYHRDTADDSAMPEWGFILDGPLQQVDLGDGVLTPVPEPLLAIAQYLEGLQRMPET